MTTRVTIEFDNDHDAEILIEAMELGTTFDFNSLGHHAGDFDDDWVNHYRHIEDV